MKSVIKITEFKEHNLLKALSTKEAVTKYLPLIKKHTVLPETYLLLEDFKKWFDLYPDKVSIDFKTWGTWFASAHSTYKEDKLKFFQAVIENVDSASEDEANDLLHHFSRLDIATRVRDIAGRYINGSVSDLTLELRKLIDEHSSNETLYNTSAGTEDSLFLPTSAESIVASLLAKGAGFKWSLKLLNESFGPMHLGDFGCIMARPNGGKCLGKGTPVLMWDGSIKLVENIRDGDWVMGPDGGKRVVSGTTRGTDILYRVSYGNGDSYVVNSAHILSLKRSKKEGRSHTCGDILNVPVEEYLEWPKGRKGRYKGWKMPGWGSEERCFLSGQFSPYVFGVWLGDGTSRNSSFTNSDRVILDAIKEEAFGLGLAYREVVRKNQGKALSAYIVGTKGASNLYREFLRALGVFGKKHIPEEILTHRSKRVRREVLAGLIDTDGSYDGHDYEITQVRRGLAEEIVSLARSCGYHASGPCEKVVKGDKYYRVHISGNLKDLPVRVEHKKPVGRSIPKRKDLHFAIDVKKKGYGEYYGFCVDADHLFVLGDYTVTHNTTLLVQEALHFLTQMPDGSKCIIVNNEEKGEKIQAYAYKNLLKQELSKIAMNPGGATAEFNRKLGNRKFYVKDQNMTTWAAEKLIERVKPSIIGFNLLGKLLGFGKDSSELENLTKLYRWGRDIGKRYNCIVLATVQADTSAEGERWMTQQQLFGSKTEVQGELDVFIGVGRPHDSTALNTRYLSACKNKQPESSGMEPSLREGPLGEVEFDGDTASFKDK